MSIKLNNVPIGRDDKRKFHDFTHDVNTTADFGFCQPTLVLPVMPNSHVNLKSSSFVRLGVMPCPTFGRIKIQQDTVYIPKTDVFEGFDHMMSETSIQSAFLKGNSYVPDHADFLHAGPLLDFLLRNGRIPNGSYDINTFSNENVSNIFSQLFTFGIETNFIPRVTQPDHETPTFTDEWKTLREQLHIDTADDFVNRQNYLTYLRRFLTENENYLIFRDPLNHDADVYSRAIDYDGVSNDSWFFSSLYDGSLVHAFVSPSDFEGLGHGSFGFGLADAFKGMSPEYRLIFEGDVTSKNYDFAIEFAPSAILVASPSGSGNFDRFYEYNVGTASGAISGRVRLLAKLTPFGRRLFKILNACGFNFKQPDYRIEVDKLFAYYKAWFSLYNPNRTMNWKDTNAYFLVHRYFDSYMELQNYIPYTTSEEDINLVRTRFRNFINDLVGCCYMLDADQITVATPLTTQSSSPDKLPLETLIEQSYDGNPDVQLTADNYPALAQNVQGNAMSIQLLTKLYYLTNKTSVLASDIERYMQARYGVDIRTHAVMGRSDFYCQISDIMATVNNEQTSLGEYGGKGIGAGDSKEMKFDVEHQGYVIQLTTVVPLGGYVQASAHPQIDKMDFYEETLDSMGQEPLPYSEVFGRESVLNFYQKDKTFGFRPYYFGLKYRNNLANGDFSFRSKRGSLLPYSLDRLFSEGDFAEPVGNKQLYELQAPVELHPDEDLRSIGKYETYGNYDRIFMDTTGFNDNFIIHMIQHLAYYAPMLPARQSFQAVDPDGDNKVTEVNHA